MRQGPKTSKTASVLNLIETNKVKKDGYLIRRKKKPTQFNEKVNSKKKRAINIYFLSIRQDKKESNRNK